MILESAHTLRAIGWYLIAQHGDATVRVRSGMALGQDAAGELTLNPKAPLVEFTLADDGSLLLTVVSSIYELQVAQQAETTRALHVAPETPAQIAFLNNVMAIDTGFTNAAHGEETLEIRIVPIRQRGTIPAAITKLLNEQKRLPAEIDGEILVPEAGLARFSLQAVRDFMRTKLAALPQPQSLSTSSGVFAGVVMATLVVGGLYLTSPERAGIQQAKPRVEQIILAKPIAVPKIAPSLEIVSVETDNPVLVSVSALLDQTQLPNESTIDFAVQSLKALLAAYPNDPQVRQGLEQLASRLTREARLSYDRGDVGGAERLLAQAAASGVALEETSEALAYLSTPQAPRTAQTAGSPLAQGGATAPRGETSAAAETRASEGRNAVDRAVETSRPSPTTSASEVSTAAEQQIGTRDPPQALARSITNEPSEPEFAAVPATDPTLAVAGPQNPLAEQSVPVWERSLSTEASLRPQPARAMTPVATAPRDTSTPALYPLALLTAIRRNPPAYPRIAPEGAEASVDIVMTVTKTGEVQDVEVRNNPPDYFARSATRAVKRWRFQPVLDNGKPVAVRTSVRLTFRG